MEELHPQKIVEPVVDRPEIGIDFFLKIARQKPEMFPGLDRRAGQDEPLDLLLLQRIDGHGQGQIGLAGTRRTDAENDILTAHRFKITFLPDRFRADLFSPGGNQEQFAEKLA